MINKLAHEVHENAKSKGFYDEPKNIGEMLCLIHSEVSEALEADRTGKYTDLEQKWHLEGMADAEYGITFSDNLAFIRAFERSVKNSFEDELADIVIRVMDLAAFKGIDLESHIKAKIRYNTLREHKHGKKY